jgi:low temperature requirement protein LtrA
VAETLPAATEHPLLRRRDGHHARVTSEELFFDLVYVFAVTQLSHLLLHHLTPMGALETLVLWFAVWLGWQFTCWVTNWFDPETRAIRLLLFALMMVALVMAAAIPLAFGSRGLLFATAYVTIQVGRTAVVLLLLGRDHALAPIFRRIFIWFLISGVLWIAGGLAEHGLRLALWALAVLCEYVSPMTGFAVPGLGRSRTSDWTVEGGHLAERCQLFVIVALGETLLVTGARLSEVQVWEAPVMIAFLVTFLGSIAMWLVYFGTSGKDGSAVITRSQDPGQIGAYFNYIHAVLVGGIIATAVGNDLVIGQPDGSMTPVRTAALIAGPAIYLAGSAFYKRVVYGCWPPSHLAGLGALAVLAAFARLTDLLMIGGLTTLLLLGVAAWDFWAARPHRPLSVRGPSSGAA